MKRCVIVGGADINNCLEIKKILITTLKASKEKK